jgi:hypothetical protein
VETAIHRASPSVMRASRGVRRSNCKQIWLRVHDPDSSTVPNTASNAKDHGNAPRRFVRDCGIVCRKVGRIVENSAIGQN